MLYGWLDANTIHVGAADTIDELLRFYDLHLVVPATTSDPADLQFGRPHGRFLFVRRSCEISDNWSVLSLPNIDLTTQDDVIQRQIDLLRSRDRFDLGLFAREPTLGELIYGPQSIKSEPEVVFARNGTGITISSDDESSTIREAAERALTAEIRRIEAEVASGGTIKTDNFVVFAINQGDLYGDGQLATLAHFALKRRITDDNSRAVACPAQHLAAAEAIMEPLVLGIYHAERMTPQEATDALSKLGYHHDDAVMEIFDPAWVRPQRGLALSEKRGSQFARFDIKNVSLEALETSWENEDWTYANKAAGFGESGNDVWYAFTVPNAASRFRTRVLRFGHSVTPLFVVTAENVPVDAIQISTIEPRPWNTRSLEVDATTPDGYSAREFAYARVANGIPATECRLIIVPAEYFRDTKQLFDKKLGIDHLLPPHLTEIKAGMYSTTTADWATLDAEMGRQRGFRSSLMLTIFANQL